MEISSALREAVAIKTAELYIDSHTGAIHLCFQLVEGLIFGVLLLLLAAYSVICHSVVIISYSTVKSQVGLFQNAWVCRQAFPFTSSKLSMAFARGSLLGHIPTVTLATQASAMLS